MNLPDGLIASPWPWLGNLGYALIVLYTLIAVPWWRLADGRDANVLMAATVGVLLVWSLKAGVAPGLSFHQLGATLLMLMFGWAYALVALSVVLLATTLNGASGWETFGLNALAMAVVPVWVSLSLQRFAERFLPANFFVYIFFCAFLAAAAAMASAGLVSTLVLLGGGAYDWAYLSQHYVPYYLLMLFPEGFLTGMLMAIFVVYRPQWVSSFDDRRYLKGK
jgi:uncharacterized membrane protein